MAGTIYEGPGRLYFNGNPLAEAKSVRWSVSGRHNPVRTMRKGFSGISRGAPESNINVSNAVPIDGLEADFVEQCIAGAQVRIVVRVAGKSYGWNAYIDEVSGEQDTDTDAGVSFTAIAGPPEIR
jgi:hypothetical protein